MKIDSPYIPRHVAVVMDGNGRWARSRLLPRTAGHKKGVDATRRLVEDCSESGVEVLTVFAFSSENWQRPETEVSVLMELFFASLRKEAARMADHNIQMKIIGDKQRFPQKLQQAIIDTEQVTEHCDGMRFNIAANYGGRQDMLHAAKLLCSDLEAGLLSAGDVNEQAISARTQTAGLPDPDLFIRTGGEQRISNFLLWQLAYAELYFTDVLWPDFDTESLKSAFDFFSSRERRFGKTSEQVQSS
ncbi:MAG: isoprenyl transferase [Thiotrichales bacterium]